jgi:hypothetical protein
MLTRGTYVFDEGGISCPPISQQKQMYALEEDYERILWLESLSNSIPIHAEQIKAFRRLKEEL